MPPSTAAPTRNGGRGYDQQQNLSPSLISPALTYSSTPSTLSPATPFFELFTGSQGDGLFGVGIVDASGGERGVQVNLTAIEGLKCGAGGMKGGLGLRSHWLSLVIRFLPSLVSFGDYPSTLLPQSACVRDFLHRTPLSNSLAFSIVTSRQHVYRLSFYSF